VVERLLRICAEQLFPAGVAGRRIRSTHTADLLVLAFHNVIPDNAPVVGDRSLHLKLSSFCGLIDRLLESSTAVQLGYDPGAAPQPRFVVTFDDAYRGAVTLALPELARRSVPSTTFVPTAMVGDRTFWWDALADSGGGLDPRLREHALESLRGDDVLIREWAAGQGLVQTALPTEWHTTTLDELRRAVELPGVALAPHSATHRALDRLEPGELGEELRAPLAWFAEHGLPCQPYLAYPYGRWSPMVREATAGAGYEGAWLIAGGWTGRHRTEPFTLPRLNVPSGASVRRLIWRVAHASSSA
jgi:peptidoglycan/xylan/chitin deacetylase (PgdA/CDA1 family)